MNITKRELFKDFYSKRIYFLHKRESFKSEVITHEFLDSVINIKCKDWEKTPVCYLSAREALALGIQTFLRKAYRGKAFVLRSIELCEYSYMESKESELSFLSVLALGVLYFELALSEEGEEQQKYFKLSAAYLKTAKKISPEDDHCELYHAVVQQSRGQDLIEIAKTLVKASKVSPEPQLIYKILTNIYYRLDMDDAAIFYQEKFDKACA